MGRPRLNLLGKKFGKLRVLKDAGYMQYGKGTARYSTWFVQCECGTKKRVLGSSLARGVTRSCGCGRKKPPAPKGKKNCCTCKDCKPLSNFYRLRSSPDGRYPNCIDCYKKKKKKSITTIRAGNRAWARRLREEVVKHYGGKCACCGEKTFEFLAIDHVKGGGKKHRAAIRTTLPWWLKKNGYPKGFRVLCHNCNTALGVYKYCPHYDEPSV
jgi:hypothetical protein